MRNKLVILLLIDKLFMLNFEIQNQEFKILKNTENYIQPFRVINNDDEKIDSIILELQCGQNFDQNFQLQYNQSVVRCNLQKQFTEINTLNEFLYKLEIKILQNAQNYSSSINYKISYQENKTYEIYQKLNAYREIPVYLKNTTLSTQNDNSGQFQQEILTIETDYLNKSNPSNLQLIQLSNDFPNWLSYMIKDQTLIFYGSYPSKQEENIVVNFKLFDQQSQLYSQNIDFWILKNFQQDERQIFKVFTVLFILLFMLVVFLFVFLLFKFMRKKQKKEQLKRSIEGHNLRRQSSSYQGATVLSQSILQWNKQLVMYHREKSDTPTHKNNKSYDFNQYSFEEKQDNMDDIEDMKDISKIDHSNNQNIEKSSFLSGIKINQIY